MKISPVKSYLFAGMFFFVVFGVLHVSWRKESILFRRLADHGITVRGEVNSIVHGRRGRTGSTYGYEYAVDGTTYWGKDIRWLFGTQIGDAVELLVDPENPEIHVIDRRKYKSANFDRLIISQSISGVLAFVSFSLAYLQSKKIK